MTENDITDSVAMNLGKLLEMMRESKAWHATVCGVTKSQTRPGDRTTMTNMFGLHSVTVLSCFLVFYLRKFIFVNHFPPFSCVCNLEDLCFSGSYLHNYNFI